MGGTEAGILIVTLCLTQKFVISTTIIATKIAVNIPPAPMFAVGINEPVSNVCGAAAIHKKVKRAVKQLSSFGMPYRSAKR